jgi:hypothetical protein
MAYPLVHKLVGGEVCVWIEQESSIHLKAVAAAGDPVEMTWNDARKLGELLIRLADEGERMDEAG